MIYMQDMVSLFPYLHLQCCMLPNSFYLYRYTSIFKFIKLYFNVLYSDRFAVGIGDSFWRCLTIYTLHDIYVKFFYYFDPVCRLIKARDIRLKHLMNSISAFSLLHGFHHCSYMPLRPHPPYTLNHQWTILDTHLDSSLSV